MNEKDISDELQRLKARCAAQQTALQLVLHCLPPKAKKDLESVANGVEEETLALPIPDLERETYAETLRHLAKPLSEF